MMSFIFLKDHCGSPEKNGLWREGHEQKLEDDSEGPVAVMQAGTREVAARVREARCPQTKRTPRT